jgi:NADH-quinone oxidoreductase subunit N
MDITWSSLIPLIPLGIIVATGALLLLYEVFAVQSDRAFCAHIAVAGSIIALYLAFSQVGEPARALFGTTGRGAPILVDAFSTFASIVMIMGGAIACLFSPGYLRNADCDHGEYYALLLFAVASMMVMAMAGDLIVFFLGLESMSLAVYALTGMRRNDPRASESALKYFLMGSFATGFLLFGIAMVYGVTGGIPDHRGVALSDLQYAMRMDEVSAQPLLTLGLVLIIVGFAFKVAAVPFHMWAPDVYEGAPTPISGFMATGVKTGAFVALLRIVMVGLRSPGQLEDQPWISLLSVLAVTTIIGGNILALVQQNVKRMLAYSSISHAGYLLIGVVAAARGEDKAGEAVLFYLAAYTFMTLGAFGVLTFLERRDGGFEAERFGAFAGMGFKHPALGFAMSLFMVALGGIPPTAGFFGKLFLFSAAIRAGETPLALVGIFGSLVSIYYYLRVIVAFYMRDVPDPGPVPTATRTLQLGIGLTITVAAVLYLGIFPGHWLELGKTAIESLGAG